MFGFLKKKLKEAVDKISGVASEEVSAEKIAEAESEVLQEKELKEDIEEKQEFIQESEIIETPELEEAVEKPAEQIMEEVAEPETETVAEEKEITEYQPEKTPAELKEEIVETEEKTFETPEIVEEKIITEKPEIIEERNIPEMPETAKEKTIPEKPSQKKIGFLERLKGRKKPDKAEKVSAKAELPRGLEISEEVEKKEEKEKAGLFRKIRKAVSEKTIEESDIKDILWDLQIGLIESDVAVEAAEKISSELKKDLVGRSLPKKGIEDIVKASMRKSIKEILDVGGLSLAEKAKTKKPFLVLFLGFNGVGKTTSIARVGHLLKEKGFSCIFAAADTWRAGAIQQIEEHGGKLGIKVIRQEYGSDPAAIIFDAKKYAEAHGIDVILADTAGRSHTNTNLVDELKKIVRVNKPDLKILVLDALTGNDVVEQAKYFHEAAGVDGIIMTKADVYEKGGALLSAVHTIRKPIMYLGVGQGYGDLEEFDVEKVVERLLE